MTIYEFNANAIDGNSVSLADYSGQALLIVNVASACGFTPQYAGLQELYEKYRSRGFSILGFPCNQFGNQEPGAEPEILSFCQVRYGVTFPMFAKIDVNGAAAHPLFRFLETARPGILGTARIKWNFTKFLIDRDGRPVARFGPRNKPEEIEPHIVRLLSKPPASR